MRGGAAGREGQGGVPGGAEAGADRRVVVPVGRGDHPGQRGRLAARRAEPGRRAGHPPGPRPEDRGPAAVPAAGRRGRARGYATPAERHAKTLRLKALKARLARVERRVEAGAVPVTRGGKACCASRHNLAAAGLTGSQWRGEWEAARLFLTADGEKRQGVGKRDDPAGTPTRAGWRSSSPPRSRTWRTGRTAATGCRARSSSPTVATRSPRRPPPGRSVTTSPATRRRGRWYLDGHVEDAPAPGPVPGGAPAAPVVAVDVNAGHLDVAVIAADGNVVGTRSRSRWNWPGCRARPGTGGSAPPSPPSSPPRRSTAREAIVIEDLDFDEARAEGRERTGSRPSRGRRGRGIPAAVAGIPTAKFRDRLMQMTANAGLSRSRGRPGLHQPLGGRALARPAARAPPRATGHHAAALVIGQTRTRPPGQDPREREPHRPGGRGAASPGAAPETPGGQALTQETRRPTRPTAAARR